MSCTQQQQQKNCCCYLYYIQQKKHPSIWYQDLVVVMLITKAYILDIICFTHAHTLHSFFGSPAGGGEGCYQNQALLYKQV